MKHERNENQQGISLSHPTANRESWAVDLSTMKDGLCPVSPCEKPFNDKKEREDPGSGNKLSPSDPSGILLITIVEPYSVDHGEVEDLIFFLIPLLSQFPQTNINNPEIRYRGRPLHSPLAGPSTEMRTTPFGAKYLLSFFQFLHKTQEKEIYQILSPPF